MRSVRRLLDRVRPTFRLGGRLGRLRPLYDYWETFWFDSGRATSGAPHVRDALDLRRVMAIWVVALLPCLCMAMWNTGYQANVALEALGRAGASGWRGGVLSTLGIGTSAASPLACLLHGALYVLPAFLVALFVGSFWVILFGVARRRTLSEGLGPFALLFVLTLPPAVPLWQVALGTTFGIVVAQELFGGYGRHFVHPAMAARAFLYFGYPADHAGNEAWVAVDGFTSATPLTSVSVTEAARGMDAVGVTWAEAFLGTMPGSMGETSTLACLLGAAVLLAAHLASWRVMVSMLAGAVATSSLFFAAGSDTNAMFSMPPHWHLVTGGLAFGTVFLATDSVTSAQTDGGRWVYGLLMGFFCIVVRVLNPGFAESVMIVILLGNVFAPLIDWFVCQRNVRRRRARVAA